MSLESRVGLWVKDGMIVFGALRSWILCLDMMMNSNSDMQLVRAILIGKKPGLIPKKVKSKQAVAQTEIPLSGH